MTGRPAIIASTPPRIGICEADLRVNAAPGSPLGSPEQLLSALRVEILPVLEQVLDQEPLRSAEAQIEQLDIDLGQWPENPDWVDLRFVFAQKLRAALAPYLRWPDDTKRNDPSHPAEPISGAARVQNRAGAQPPDPLSNLSDAEYLASVRAYLNASPDHRERLYSSLFGSVDAIEALTAKRSADTVSTLKSVLRPELGRSQAPTDPWQILEPRIAQIADSARRAWLEAGIDKGSSSASRRLIDDLQKIAAQVFEEAGQDPAGSLARASELIAKLALHPDIRMELLAKPKAAAMSLVPQEEGVTQDASDQGAEGATTDQHDAIRTMLSNPSLDLAELKQLWAVSSPQMRRIFAKIDESELSRLIRLAAPADPAHNQRIEQFLRAEATNASALQRLLVNLLGGQSLSPGVPDAVGRPNLAITNSAKPLDFTVATLSEIQDRTRLKQLWIVHPEATRQMVSTLPPTELSRLIRIATPEHAGLLAERLEQFLRMEALNADTLRQMLFDLLDERVLNFDRLDPNIETMPDLTAETLVQIRNRTRLKKIWNTQPVAMRQTLLALPPTELSRLIRIAAPENADLLAKKLEQFLRTDASNSDALREILIDFLDERVLNFDRLETHGEAVTASQQTDVHAKLTSEVFQTAEDLRERLRVTPDFLHRLPHDTLTEWLDKLLPAGAELLREAIDRKLTEIEHPTPLLIHVVTALLENRPVDLDAALEDLAPHESRAAEDIQPPTSDSHAADQNSLQQFENADQSADLSARMPRKPALHALLSALGLNDAEMRYVLDPPKPQIATNDGANGAERHSDPYLDQIDPARISKTLDGLFDAGLVPSARDWRAHFDLVWRTLPPEYLSFRQEIADADQTEDTPDDALADFDAAKDPRYWRALLAGAIPDAQTPDLPDALIAVFETFEPDPDKRVHLLRLVATRLSYAAGAGSPAARNATHAAAEIALQRLSAQSSGNLHEEGYDANASPTDGSASKPEPVITNCAGLILLHPFLKLLFERLGLLGDENQLPAENLSRAYSVLHAIAGTSEGPPDPLHYVLLGLEGRPKLELTELEPSAHELIDGLLSAVITQWGKLGKTSPDGLRESFLNRMGQLSHDDTGAHLRVEPGPFDMLLDALPWAVTPVALPWMRAPCHVIWRNEDG